MVIGVALTQDDMQRITASVGLAAKVLSESVEDVKDVEEVMRLNILYAKLVAGMKKVADETPHADRVVAVSAARCCRRSIHRICRSPNAVLHSHSEQRAVLVRAVVMQCEIGDGVKFHSVPNFTLGDLVRAGMSLVGSCLRGRLWAGGVFRAAGCVAGVSFGTIGNANKLFIALVVAGARC